MRVDRLLLGADEDAALVGAPHVARLVRPLVELSLRRRRQLDPALLQKQRITVNIGQKDTLGNSQKYPLMQAVRVRMVDRDFAHIKASIAQYCALPYPTL